MRHLKKLKTTLRSFNFVACFIGLYLGILATFDTPIIVVIAMIMIVVFTYYRFGTAAMLTLFLAFLCGFSSRYLTSSLEPASAHFYLVIDAHENYLIVQNKLTRLYVYMRHHPYQVGDVILAEGFVKPINFFRVEGQFDFAKYLNNKGIQHELIFTHKSDVFLLPWRIQNIKSRFLNNFDSDTRIYLDAILFATRDYNHDIVSNLASLNLLYLLSVSGLLIHGHLKILNLILIRFMSEKKAQRLAFISLVPWLFLNITSVVLWRIIGGSILNLILKDKGSYHWSYWSKKASLGIMMLLFSRYIVNHPGFYLSFGIASILYIVKENKHHESIMNRLKNRYIPLLILLPFLANTQGLVNLISWLLLGPLVMVHSSMLTLGLLSLYSLPLVNIIRPLTRLSHLLISSSQVVKLQLHFAMFTPLIILGYYLFFSLSFFLKQLHVKVTKNIGCFGLTLMIIFSILPISNLYEQALFFINVGQGDAILIKNKRSAILIDTGGSIYLDIASVSLVPFFHRHGIDKIDTLIITHDDYDHRGALNSLQSQFPISEIILEPTDFPIVRAGIHFDNINPLNQCLDANMCSLVLYFQFMDYQWLLMGDAPSEVEILIIDNHPILPTDYLKVGHHGSTTSTSTSFLRHIQPHEAIISVGQNQYGHPHPEIIRRLEEQGITIRRTDIEGTITYRKVFS